MDSTAKQVDQMIEQGGEDDFVDELKPGTELLHGQYVIEEFLNSGGFGITYLAKDSLDRRVVIKECFPNTLCRRSYARVGARSRAHQAEFKSVIDLFVQEAKSLAKLKHPNIVGVHQVFEDNDTAYMALDYIEGFDLLETLEDGGKRLPPEKINKILRKILGAVDYLHGQNILHRDISPDNILIDRKTSEPLLIDFGAAREEVSKASRVLSALRVVKDGYSPQEFYVNGSKQGPASDLYALAASFYHLITGEIPTDSQTRLAALASDEDDPYVPLAGRIEGYDEAFLSAIDKALNVLPKDRIQTAKEWLEMISGGVSALPTAGKPASVSEGTNETKPTNSGSKMLLVTTAILLVTAGGGYAVWKGMSPAPVENVASTTETTDPAPANGNKVNAAVETPVIASAAVSEELIATDTPVAEVAITDTPVGNTDVVMDTPIPETPDVATDVVDSSIVDALGAFEDIATNASVLDTPENFAEIIEDAPVVDILDVPADTAADTAQTADIDPDIATDTVVVDDISLDVPNVDAQGVVADIPKDTPETDTSVVNESVVTDTPVVDSADTVAEVVVDTPVADPPETTSDVVAALEAPVEIEPAVETAPVSSETEVAIAPPATPVNIETVGSLGFLPVKSAYLPFSDSADQPGIIANIGKDAPAWVQVGQQITAVNGVPIESFSQINPTLRSLDNLDDLGSVRATFTIAGTEEQQTENLAVVSGFVLPAGLELQMREVPDGTVRPIAITTQQAENSIIAGDVILTFLNTGEKIGVDISLEELLLREINQGNTELNFIIDRGGKKWIAPVQLTGNN